MANKIQIRRGLKTNLPVLDAGEPALCTDTGEVFVGNTSAPVQLVNNAAYAEHLKDYVLQIPYAAAGGSANAYTVSLNPALAAYAEGVAVAVKINGDNTGAATLNINSLGAKSIVDSKGSALTAGKLKANSIYTLRYNGTNFILQGEGASGNALASDLLSGKTASTDAGEITGTMPNRGAVSITPGSTSQAIAAGYHNGSGSVAGDADLTAANIRKGVNVFGVTGTLAGIEEYRYGSGVDGSLNTTGDVTFTSSLDGDYVIKQYTSVTINAGHTVTVSNRCKGLIIASQGNIVINGKIDMKSKGANFIPPGSTSIFIDFLKTVMGTNYTSSLGAILALVAGGNGGNGGAGGNSSITSFHPYTYSGAGGAGGSAAYSTPYGNGMKGAGGGGGSGAATDGYYGYFGRGDGGAGGYSNPGYAGASGGAAANFTNTVGPTNIGNAGSNSSGGGGTLAGANPGYIWAAAGGASTNGGGAGGGGGAAGAHNSGSTWNAVAGTAGSNFGGGLIVLIAQGNITINSGGVIDASGGNGGNGGAAISAQWWGGEVGEKCAVAAGGGGGGGGAGGGTVMLFRKGTYTNNGTVSAAGGSGGTGGAASYSNGGFAGQSASAGIGTAGSSGSAGTVLAQQIS